MPTQSRFSRDGRLTTSCPRPLTIAMMPVCRGVGAAPAGWPTTCPEAALARYATGVDASEAGHCGADNGESAEEAAVSVGRSDWMIRSLVAASWAATDATLPQIIMMPRNRRVVHMLNSRPSLEPEQLRAAFDAVLEVGQQSLVRQVERMR